MALRGPRFSGDPILEECFAGRHRMLFGEDGLPVKRVQHALIELGETIPDGPTGFFGNQTGAAVTSYKTRKGLVPNDPVVGAGTSKALDDDLFFDPPELDPAFAEFSPTVVAHRLEPFAALELAALIGAPLDSWRHMLGQFALTSLSSGLLLGIVAQSRSVELRPAFLAVADSVQPNGQSAEDFFDNAIIAGDSLATAFPFAAGDESRAFIVIRDTVILERETIRRESDGARAPVTLLGVLVHELTHVRNLSGNQALADTPDTDPDAFIDTALAQARTAATGIASADVVRRFVGEIVARHVHWILLQELAGTPGTIAVQTLAADQLGAGAFFYFVEVPPIYDTNGYGAGINAQGDRARFQQLELWMKLAAGQFFSDVPEQDDQSTLLFNAAAQLFADRAASPVLTAFPDDAGVFPGRGDFH